MSERKFAFYYMICYRIFFAALLAGIVLESLGELFGVYHMGMWNRLVVCMVIILVACVNYGRVGVRVVSIIVLAVGGFSLIPLLISGQIVQFFQDYISWLFQSGEYNEQWGLGYELIQTVWISIGCYGYQILTEKRNGMKGLTAFFLAVIMVLSMVFGWNITKPGVAFIISYVLLWYVEILREGWNKKKQRNKKEYTLFLLPYFMVFMLVLTYLPNSALPYQWTTMRLIYGRVCEEVVTWWEEIKRNGAEDFGFTTTGFSEDGRILGGFTKDEKKLMTIEGDVTLVTNMYLRGRTYDTFDGREWFKNLEENLQEYPLDTLETIYAIRRYNGRTQGNYIHKENAKVRYDFFNTKVLFTPLKLAKVRYDEYEIKGRDFVLDESNGYGMEYELDYYQLNLDKPEFHKLLEAQLDEDEKLWNNIIKSSGVVLKKVYTLEDLKQYRKTMVASYSEELAFTEELQEYLNAITYGSETGLQMLKAIEKELSGYHYTSSPGKLPGRIQTPEDFLEYFLLEKKEGYCAHYATAFVLLARYLGFPARYVEGFSVPVTQEKVMEVYSGRAHSWPEVYFEGVGWISFEPTPGYGDIHYDGWEIKKQIEEDVEEEETEEIIETPKPTVIENQQEIQEALLEKEKAIKRAKDRERLMLILKSIGGIVFLCLLVLLVERAIRKGRYKRMNTENKFLVEVRRNLWLLTRLGYKREEAETLSELQDRIREDIPELFESKGELVFFKGYEEYLYRSNIITEEVLQNTIKERKELLSLVKEESRWLYSILRLRMWLSISW